MLNYLQFDNTALKYKLSENEIKQQFRLYYINMLIFANYTDEQLAAMVRERDQEIYGELIRRYQAKLTHYLRKFIRNPDELEDVLQDVFIKAFKNLNGFDISKKFSSWVYRIAHNEAVNRLKKNSKESLSLDDCEWEIIDEKIDINGKIDAGLAKNIIEKKLALMKEKYRAPIILYFFEQKTYEEIAEILKIPTSTVGTLILRGKNILKKYLEKEMYARKQ